MHFFFKDRIDRLQKVNLSGKDGMVGVTGKVLIAQNFAFVVLIECYHFVRNGEGTQFSEESFEADEGLFKEV